MLSGRNTRDGDGYAAGSTSRKRLSIASSISTNCSETFLIASSPDLTSLYLRQAASVAQTIGNLHLSVGDAALGNDNPKPPAIQFLLEVPLDHQMSNASRPANFNFRQIDRQL
jgi:hypothetical protein